MYKLASPTANTRVSSFDTVPVISSDIKSGRQSTDDEYPRDQKLSWDVIRTAIPKIEFLVAYQGDFARVTSDIEQLAGKGHRITLIGPDERDIKLSQLDLNVFARKISQELGGLPGVINDLFLQLTIAGATSQEAVISYDDSNKTIGKVSAIEPVDVPTIEFHHNKQANREMPHQRTSDGRLVPLMFPKYQMQVIKRLGNKKYPIPPFLAALSEMGRLNNALASIDKAIRKMGLLGLLALQVKKPIRMFFESERAYQARLDQYLDSIHATLQKGFVEGIVTHYASLESPKLLNFSGEINNSLGFMKLLHQRLNQSLGDWLTDDKARASSWVSVLYEKMLSKLEHTQSLVANVLEVIILLHLLLKGRKIYDVQLTFAQDSKRYWEKKLIEADFFQKLVAEFEYDKDKALEHLGFGAERESRTFPLHVQDILSRNYYGVHAKHTDVLFCGGFGFNHYMRQETNSRLYERIGIISINTAEL